MSPGQFDSQGGLDGSRPVFVISVAAELAGMHPQTLRQYDRMGLVSPQRTSGRGRRYSQDDIEQLREVQRLSQDEGINLAGIKRILRLRQRVMTLEHQLRVQESQLRTVQARLDRDGRVFAAGSDGDVVAMRAGSRPRARRAGTSLVVWRPQQRGR